MTVLDAQVTDLGREVERYYYKEARLLDDRLFNDWLELWTDDAHYWAPLRYNRTRREQHLEFSQEGEYAYFDDDKDFLAARIRRLDTGMAWAEDPPSRTRHLITNVEAEPDTSGVGDLAVRSHFLVYRNRLETEVDLFAGARHDVLRRTEAGDFLIARRKVVFDCNVLLSKNLSIFF